MIFSKELSVGNRIIDSEHKNLHGIINGIAGLIEARDIATLHEAFELLENRLHAYFAVEETVAQAVNFDFTQHKLSHQRLLSEFRRIKHGLMSKNGLWTKLEKAGHITSLRKCLARHIAEDGKPLKIVLSEYLYDFKPDSGGGSGLQGIA